MNPARIALALAVAVFLAATGLAEGLEPGATEPICEDVEASMGISTDMIDPPAEACGPMDIDGADPCLNGDDDCPRSYCCEAMAADDAAGIPVALRMGLNESYLLGGGDGYTSSNPGVASVDAAGLVVARQRGAAVITVTSGGGVVGLCTVTVVRPPKRVKLPRMTATSVGRSIALYPRVRGGACNAFIWTSSDPGVATVDANGVVTGIGVGCANITASTYNGKRAVCAVYVGDDKSAHPVLSIAHRGGCGYWPENTLEAFRNAASTGADGVEMDARSTLDGVQVIHHDPAFTLDGRCWVLSKLTFAQLRALRPDVPTLDEALEVLAGTGLIIHLELKDTADGAKCVEAVRNHGLADRTVYFSFFKPQLRQVYRADPGATLGLSLSSRAVFNARSLRKKARNLHVCFFVAHKSLLNQAVVDYWHSLGFRISAWTPNTPGEVRRLYDLGVDYILSDYPDYCVACR